MPLIFASLQLGGSRLQRGGARAGKKKPIPRRCSGPAPPEKVVRWGFLHFFPPRAFVLDALHQDKAKALPRPLRALACWRVRRGEGMPPLSTQPEGSPSKRKYEASKRDIDWRCWEGAKNWGQWPPLSRHRGGLSDRVHLEGRGKIQKQTAGCKNGPKPNRAEKAHKTRSEALQNFRQ